MRTECWTSAWMKMNIINLRIVYIWPNSVAMWHTYYQHRCPEIAKNHSHNHKTCWQDNCNSNQEMFPQPNVLFPKYKWDTTWVVRHASRWKLITYGADTLKTRKYYFTSFGNPRLHYQSPFSEKSRNQISSISQSHLAFAWLYFEEKPPVQSKCHYTVSF